MADDAAPGAEMPPPGDEKEQQAPVAEEPQQPSSEADPPAATKADDPPGDEEAAGTDKAPADSTDAAGAARAAALAAQYAGQYSAAAETNNNNKRPHDGEEGGDEPAAKRLNEDPAPYTGAETAGGQVSEVIQVSQTLVGKLIGKAGATIKEIQMRGQCHLDVDHNASGGPNVPVTIVGTPDNVALTKRLIDEVLDPVTGGAGSSAAPGPGGESVRKISCPAHIVGRIIGRGGETIRSLQTASGAHIMINQNFPEGQPREVEVTGTHDSAERAYSMIMEIINTDGSAQPQQLISKYGAGKTLELTCPKHMVGRVIGRGGETVKGLQRQYGAAIQIEQNANPCRVTITGPPGAVAAAERAILDLVEDRPPGGPGFGGFPPPYGGYPMGYPPMGYPPAHFGGYPGYGGFPGGYAGYGGYPGGYAGADPYAAAYAQQQQQQQGGGAGAAAGAGAGGAAPAAAGAGKVWQEIKDDQGRSYYYNTQTGVSQWEKPADM